MIGQCALKGPILHNPNLTNLRCAPGSSTGPLLAGDISGPGPQPGLRFGLVWTSQMVHTNPKRKRGNKGPGNCRHPSHELNFEKATSTVRVARYDCRQPG